MQKDRLAIVIPVYNEEASVLKVLEEWSNTLKKMNINFTFLVIDDGSRDSTPTVLEKFKMTDPSRMEIVRQDNQGHGQACINGYRIAIKQDYDWIFQIDSDGQCDPKFFEKFWINRSSDTAIIGHRISRDDGIIRMYVSKVLSFAILLGLGVWVKDSNVPYRLFHRNLLSPLLPKIPSDFFLANALLTGLMVKTQKVTWIPIHFRDRFGGSPSLQGVKLLKRGASIFLDFFSYRDPSELLGTK